MNFKDLQYSIGKLTTDVRSQLARNNPLHKQDTKALSMWIFNERNNLASLRTLAYQQSETIKVFQQWTKEELMNDKDENGRDIEDIGDKLVKLLEKQTEIEQQYAAKYQQYRHAIKAIRNNENRLCDIREKKRTLAGRIANLTKTSPKSPKLRELQKELASLERDTHDTEMHMGDFKRFALKEAFYLRFNAMNEYAEKTAMLAGFGNYIVDLLDIAPTPPTEPTRRPYVKGKEAAMIFADAMNAIDDWQPQVGDERPTIATNTSKYQGTTITDEDHDDNNTDDDIKTTMDDDTGKGKQVMGATPPPPCQDEHESISASAPETSTKSDITPSTDNDIPPELPPRSPLPATTACTTDMDASVPSDHKTSPQRQVTTEKDLAQLNLYDVPPPYDETNYSKQQRHQNENVTPQHSDEPTAAKQSIPDIEEPPTPSLPPAPATLHARPITHEDKQELGGQQPPATYGLSTPSTHLYQQSPQSLHSSSSQYSYHPPHQHSTSSSMNYSYGGVEPNYHQGQYQQLYDQLTERQQQGPRPYSEFQQQHMRHHQDAGGFRIPSTLPLHQDTIGSSSAYHLSADEEKRRLAEKFTMDETQARQASLQTLHQEQQQQQQQQQLGIGSSRTHNSKKSVITPEGDNHGYKSTRRE